MELAQRILGMWLGKSVGGTLGLPAEGRMARQHFSYYDPVPTQAPPNDDLELQLVWLELLERHGGALDADRLGRAWLAHIHYIWDEYGRCRWNLRRGVPAAAAGALGNWFGAGMGSPIRAEIWACAALGDPAAAAAWARLDSLLDHGPEGAAGEVLFAVCASLLLAGVPLSEAFAEGCRRIDPATETARALALVRGEHARGSAAWDAYELLLAAHRHDNFTHAPLNVALAAWALLYGGGDPDATLLLAVNGGWDADCTCASVGALLGAAGGPEAFAARWTAPIGDGVWLGPGLVGLTDPPATLGRLAERCERLARRRLSAPALPTAELPSGHLPGTILLAPNDGSGAVPWANGELPPAVLAAGGAEWDWEPGAGAGRGHHLVCLARTGARLLVDGAAVIDCPPGLPFVPAVHRCPEPGHAVFTPGGRRLRMRLELARRDPRQEASVLLAEGNRDLAPWSGEALPHPGCLPARC